MYIIFFSFINHMSKMIHLERKKLYLERLISIYIYKIKIYFFFYFYKLFNSN